MPSKHVCSFCGKEIEPGTGMMYVTKDGRVYYFCSSKCYKNMIELGRVPRKVRWTEAYRKEKEVRLHMLRRRENERENAGSSEA